MNRLKKKYHEITEWLDSLNQNKIIPGLERIQRIMNYLNNPQDKLKVIMVGGTNAKGSTCFNLNCNLTKSGIKVGCFTSPHLHTIRERIQIGNQKISKDDFNIYISKVKNIIEKHNIQATYFEVLTATAYLYFYEMKVEYAIMEIGLGGEWDAVNITNPVIAILTTLGVDHTNYLGSKIEEIAITKAKIVKAKSHVITGWPEKYHKYIPNSKSLNYGAQLIDWLNITITKLDLEIVIRIKPIMGRMEIYNNFTIDTAHNSQAIKYLIRQNKTYDKIIIGLLKDKKIKEIIRELPKESEILACNLDTERGAPASQLLEICKTLDYKCKEFNSVKNAIQYSKNEKTLIVGSFYTVSAARRYFQLEGHSEL